MGPASSPARALLGPPSCPTRSPPPRPPSGSREADSVLPAHKRTGPTALAVLPPPCPLGRSGWASPLEAPFSLPSLKSQHRSIRTPGGLWTPVRVGQFSDGAVFRPWGYRVSRPPARPPSRPPSLLRGRRLPGLQEAGVSSGPGAPLTALGRCRRLSEPQFPSL